MKRKFIIIIFALVSALIFITGSSVFSKDLVYVEPAVPEPELPRAPIFREGSRLKMFRQQVGEVQLVAEVAKTSVRTVYFLPNDRSPKAGYAQKLDQAIKQVQAFYADQMDIKGYDRKTFDFEKDAHGNLIVYQLNGQQGDTYYLTDTFNRIESEVSQAYSVTQNIILMVAEISSDKIDGVSGKGGARGANGGVAMVTALDNPSFETITHELGHAFGLQHDFRDPNYIMSYGPYQNLTISDCSAAVLNLSRFFNRGETFTDNSLPTVEITSDVEYPEGAASLVIEATLRDDEGLAQAQLFSTTTQGVASGSWEVEECQNISGQTANIQFTYSELQNNEAHKLGLEVIDAQGNITIETLFVYSESRQPQILTVSQAGDADFQSLSQAIDAAYPKDIIEILDNSVYAGSYWIVTDDITIRVAPYLSVGGEQPTIQSMIFDGANGVSLDGLTVSNSSGRGISVQNRSDITVKNSKIQGNHTAGMWIFNSAVTLHNNQISNNADWGVGIQDNSVVLASDNQITQNGDGIMFIGSSGALVNNQIAGNIGRAVSIQSEAVVSSSDNRITENGAEGIVAFRSVVTLTGDTIANNKDGVVVADNAEITIKDSQINDNAGVGISLSASQGNIVGNEIGRNNDQNHNDHLDKGLVISNVLEAVKVERNIVRDNGARGIVLINAQNVIVTNNLVTQNGPYDATPDYAIGVALFSSSAYLVNNTITVHRTGVYVHSDANATMVNAIIADNDDDIAGNIQAGDVSYSLIRDGTYNGINNNIASDPIFVAPGSDFHLQAGSLAIDAGNSAADFLPAIDLDGKPRIAGDAIDMGVYETSEQFIGDVTADGEISSNDAIWILQYVVGTRTFSEAQKQAADASGDGEITSYDAALVLQYTVGIIKHLPQ